MLMKNEVKGHRIMIDIPTTAKKSVNVLIPGMNAANVPKNRIKRIAAIKARIACIEEVINVNGAARKCLISFISTIFSPPFIVSVNFFIIGIILNFRSNGVKGAKMKK
ncbi:MAG: hypothetical protein PWQ15_97 [Methanobacterium sp.]|nr:hypothetical protein [Methanobacterium sp.]